MVAIYFLLAIPFRSYIQPLIVMMAIPFGIVGAVLGHLIMGYSLSLMSMMGIVALAGVVVNDSLVLVDYANRQRLEGDSAFDAICAAGTRRFRPVILTTLTTFGGLAPMIFETSRQARFLIPMALSLGFRDPLRHPHHPAAGPEPLSDARRLHDHPERVFGTEPDEGAS